MNQITESVVTIAVAIIGLATLAVLVSRQANTSQVIGSAGQAFGGALATAVSPITGGGGGGFNPSGSFGFGGGASLF